MELVSNDSLNQTSVALGGDYSYRVPDPPRILVPPMGDYILDLIPELTPFPAFDATTKSSSGKVVPKPHDWSYEMRAQAQSITPNLFLGPLRTANDGGFLKMNGITMTLGIKSCIGNNMNIGSRVMSGAVKTAQDLRIENHMFVVENNHSALIAQLPTINQTINAHHLAVPSSKILVFCETGNDRSAAVIASYLFEMCPSLDHISAMQAVCVCRGCVSFDGDQRYMLQTYYDLVKAKRDVKASSVPSQNPAQAASISPTAHSWALSSEAQSGTQLKRSYPVPNVEPGGMDVDATHDPDDLERFNGRSFAPFVEAEPDSGLP